MSQAETTVDRLDVVAVAPHPDDLEITCGGTLALLVNQGYKVGILDLTSGEPTPRGSLEIRARESEAARQVLGVPFRRNVGLPNRELMDSPANRYILATWFRRLMPTIVICTAGRTPAASPDHHQGHLLVEAARFYSQLTKWDDRFDGTAPYRVPHLLYAPFPFDGEVRQYHGSFVVDVTTTFEKKMEAIACYSSQFDESRIAKVRHFVSGNNISIGGRCGFAYGEFFALPTVIGTSEPFTLVMGGRATAAPVSLPGQPAPPLE